MDTDSESQICSLGPQCDFQLFDDSMHLYHDVLGETSHIDSMLWRELWQSCHGDITVANRFNFENLVAPT
jgi:hypothetical protein